MKFRDRAKLDPSQVQARVTPEAWTHGSSALRQQWFTTGYETGRIGSCDTFRGDI